MKAKKIFWKAGAASTRALSLFGNPAASAGSLKEAAEKREWDALRIVRILVIVFMVYLIVSTVIANVGFPSDAIAVPDETGGDPGLAPVIGNEDDAVAMANEINEKATGTSLLDQFIVEPFLSVANYFMSIIRSLVTLTADTSILTKQFSEINPNLYGTIQSVHTSLVIPFANAIAAIVFVVGLVKLLANSSSTEAGIDTWQLLLIFIMFGAAMTVINASWEIMVAVYALALKLVTGISGLIGVSTTIEAMKISGTNNAGIAIAAVIITFLMLLVTVICCLIINGMILMRGLEIYLYTCYSPVAFAFMITEGGRQQTEMFLKRYLALLLSGAIQILLLGAFALTAATLGDAGNFNADTDAIKWAAEFILSFVWMIVIAIAMTRSSTIARDMIGVS